MKRISLFLGSLPLPNYSSRMRIVSHSGLGANKRYSSSFFASKPTINSETVPIFYRCLEGGFEYNTAIVDTLGKHTFNRVLGHSLKLATELLRICIEPDSKSRNLDEKRVGFVMPNNVSNPVGFTAAWMTGGVAVPLYWKYPPAQWEYFLRDSGCSVLVAGEEFQDRTGPLAEKLRIPHVVLKSSDLAENAQSDQQLAASLDQEAVKQMVRSWRSINWSNRNATIVYTSGSTGSPKGVLYTHSNLQAQVKCQTEAWGWSQEDCILHCLPLHHIHGIVNALFCPLWSGATCVMLPSFDVKQVWDKIISSDESFGKINIFMGVPSMYAKLIDYHNENLDSMLMKDFVKSTCERKMRLMVSGSDALSPSLLETWQKKTGQVLLERYGMTETGMVLTNPLNGERIPGSVGKPFPGVEVKLVEEESGKVLAEGDCIRSKATSPDSEDKLGELMVRGPNVFSQYWQREEATKDAFSKDENGRKWFKTGDICSFKDNSFYIKGRSSVDIIKTGGFKVSALNIEACLKTHHDVVDCSVVGLPDETWGERVAAVMVLKEGSHLDLSDLRSWGKELMPVHWMPSELKILPEMPRNAMGKVNKKLLRKDVFSQ